MRISVIAFWIKKAEAHDLDYQGMRHNLCVFYRSCPPDPMLSGQGKPSDVPTGEVMKFKPPDESSICFSIVYAQKYCPSSVPVFMKFKHFVQENVKICTPFSHFASVYWLFPWTQLWGLLPSRRPGSTHFRQFMIYLLWNPSTVKSWVRLLYNPSRSPSPSRLLTVAPHTHWGNVRPPHVGYCSSCYLHKIMWWIFLIKTASMQPKIVPSVCTATHTLCGFLLTRWLGLTSARMTVYRVYPSLSESSFLAAHQHIIGYLVPL